MDKKSIVGFVVGAALGVGATLALTKDQYKCFTSPTYGDIRINTKTGKTWILGHSANNFAWVEVPEHK